MSPTTLSVTVRFGGQPLADIPLTTPTSTTILALKYQIRARMTPAYAEHAIKLIYNGRQLKNRVAVGKELGSNGVLKAEKRVWYVHCALPLAKDQSWESEESRKMYGDPTVVGAGDFEADPIPDSPIEVTHVSLSQEIPIVPVASTPSARGFDRLRSIQSFTTTDIGSMRSQFRANIEARHTPATMPSEDQMLRMEDRWLDSSAFSSSLAAVGTAGGSTTASNADGPATEGTEAEVDTAPGLAAARQLLAPAVAELEAEDDASRALDDTLLGVVTGFFWPVGAVVWGLREEGVWSRRRGWSVLAGVMVNLGFGIVRVMG